MDSSLRNLWGRLLGEGNKNWELEETNSCHANSSSLVFKNKKEDLSLRVCLSCLNGQIEDAGKRVAPLFVCKSCKKKGPESDFISKEGTLTLNCSACRYEWARRKFKREKREIEFGNFQLEAVARDSVERIRLLEKLK